MSISKKKIKFPIVGIASAQDKSEYFQEDLFLVNDEPAKTTIIPLRLIRMIDYRTRPEIKTERILLLIRTTGKNSDEVKAEIESSDMADKKILKQKLCSYTANIDFDFKEKEFALIKKNWYENAELKEIVACAGYQNNCFYWENAIYDCQNNAITYLKRMYEPERIDNIEDSNIDLKSSCLPVLYHSEENVLLIFRKFFYELCIVFCESSVLVCLGIALAGCFWDVFQKETQGFPSTFFVGEAQTGKSTLLGVINAIYGLDEASLMSGNSTLYAITREMSSRFNIPVFIEEFSEKIIAKVEPLIKDSYNGIARGRGKKDSIEKMPIFTSLVATSNHFFPKLSEQLLSRIVFANMKKGQFNLEKFSYFAPEKRRELSQILPVFLRCRGKIMPVYRFVYAELEQLLPNKGRHISNLAISCTIWYIVNRIMGYEFVNWRQIASDYNEMYQNLLNAEVKSSDVILNDITRLVEAGRLEFGVDWKLISGKILRLNLNKYLEKYNMTNVNTIMKPAQFRLMVANDRRFDTRTTPMKGIGRAISIDISGCEYLLEKLSIQQGMWHSSNRTTEMQE